MPRILARLLIAAALAAPAAPAGATSLSGAYLAATQADIRDDYAEAALYYDRVLTLDPANVGILTNALVAQVALGDFETARPLADRLEAADPNNQAATLVRLGDMLAAGNFTEAQAALDKAADTVNPLLAALLAGWIDVGLEDFDAARATFDGMTSNDALTAYGQYHKALALAFAGDFVGAEAILAGDDGGRAAPQPLLDRGARGDPRPDRPRGRRDQGDRRRGGGRRPGRAAARPARAPRLRPGGSLRRGDQGPGRRRRRLPHPRRRAQHHGFAAGGAVARPDRGAHPPRPHRGEPPRRRDPRGRGPARAGHGGAGHVPETSPWYVTAQIRRANTQQEAGDPDAGIVTLTALAAGHPDQIEVQSGLGDALRVAERYPEAVAAYGAAIALVPEPMPVHWPLFYTRGIANERAGNWPAAEGDFREALKLEPDQPLVLNYLGYSMVEKHENLDEALGMIEKASKAEPDDGYITDSLGWVLYRLGRYQEAVKPMLRAVELTPDDPVINDHLGDVLWMVGRKREAEFQWRRALSFGPSDDLDMDRIRKKLDVGLDKVLADRSASRTAEARVTARAGGELAPAKVNLALHVTGRRADGLHLLDSLVVFPASAISSRPSPPRGSRSRSTAPSPATSTPGPTTSSCRAAALFGPGRGAALRLDEVAAGRQRHRRRLRRRRGDPAAPRPALARCRCRRAEAILALGADLPVCLAGAGLPHVRHRRAARRPSPCRPSGWCSPTRACRSRPARSSPASPRAATRPFPRRRPSRRRGARRLARRPAQRPRAARHRRRAGRSRRSLAALAAQPGCRLARMSGSGATCFGLFAAEPEALAAAAGCAGRGRPGGWRRRLSGRERGVPLVPAVRRSGRSARASAIRPFSTVRALRPISRDAVPSCRI